MDKAQLLGDMKAYFGDTFPTYDEYVEDADGPYTVTQIKRVFGSWYRFVHLIKAFEAEVEEIAEPIKAEPVTPPVVKETK